DWSSDVCSSDLGRLYKFKRGQPAVLANDRSRNLKDFALVINRKFGGSRNIRLLQQIREGAGVTEIHHLCDYILPAFLVDDDDLFVRHEGYDSLRTPFVLIWHQSLPGRPAKHASAKN